MSEIIGLPAIVSTRHRIVIDKLLRELYSIPKDGLVYLLINKNRLQIFPAKQDIPGLIEKEISIGRFNLPMEWVNSNKIEVGSHVYLIATEDCILVCPSVKRFERTETYG